MLVCSRTACKRELRRTYYLIWNNPPNGPRAYCVGCGSSIIAYNRTQKAHDIQLEYEIVKVTPEGPKNVASIG